MLASCTRRASRNPSVSVTIWRLRPLMRLPASIARARPPEPTRGRQQRRNLRPLPRPRVACIAQLVTPILLPSDFSPHVVPPSLSANKTESHITEITQFIFGQPLRRREAPSRRTHDHHPTSTQARFALRCTRGEAADRGARSIGF